METRRRLLQVARVLFQERGFHGVGLEEIAAAAGVTRQAVYKSHFASKADLVLELTRHVHVEEDLEALIQPTREASSGLEMLERSIRAIIQIQMKVHDLAIVLSTAARTDEGARIAWQETMGAQRAGIRRALERVQLEGCFNPDWELEVAVDMLAMILSTDSYQQLINDSGWEPNALVERVWVLSKTTFLVAPSVQQKNENNC